MTAMYVKEQAPCRSPFKPNGGHVRNADMPPVGLFC